MRNESDIKEILTAYMKANVPARCAAIETDTGKKTPAPKLIAPYPARPPGASEWPAVFVAGGGRAAHRQLDTSVEGDPIFEVDYRFTIELWCLVDKHDDFGGVDDLRAREEQALIEVLLDKSGLSEPDRPTRLADYALDVDETSVVSRPSDIFESTQGQQAQAVEIEFVVASIETLTRPVLATASVSNPLTKSIQTTRLP